MKLLDYLEPMKTLPNRFSNLAFWRILRVFKDEIVEAFTYVNTWGNGIEKEQSSQNAALTSHGEMIKRLNTLTYDGSENFTHITYSQTNVRLDDIGNCMYFVRSTDLKYTFDCVPFFVDCRASISVYKDSSKSEIYRCLIPMSYTLGNDGGSTYLEYNTTPFYAPYGVESLNYIYIGYFKYTQK